MISVWTYTVARNEAVLMPYFLRHYATFCDRIIVYDDASDDGTQAIVTAAGAELRAYPGSGLDDQAFVDFASQQYREARDQADYVIWVDADELVYHPRLKERLVELRAAGVTLPKVDGYNMFALAPPTGDGQIYEEITSGFAHERYSKVCVLDPSLDLTWEVGKHAAYVRGAAIQNTDDPLKLLHFRYLGEAYHRARSAKNFQRLSAHNRAAGFGFEVAPGWTGEYSADWYAEQAARVEVCV